MLFHSITFFTVIQEFADFCVFGYTNHNQMIHRFQPIKKQQSYKVCGDLKVYILLKNLSKQCKLISRE